MWWEIAIDVARRRFDRVSGALFGEGASGVQEEHRPGEAPPPRQPWDSGPPAKPTERVIVKAWFENPDREKISALVGSVAGLDAGPVRWSPVPEVDYEESWKANFPVLEVSPRITVAPPWDPRPGAVIIEPGQGFGTGHHPTTRMALRAIDALARPGATCLDVGCGSGVLAIAAARLGMIASGFDVEVTAISDAIKNAERNGVAVAFRADTIDHADPADLVVANLHAELIAMLASDLVRVTRGDLVLAGILADREALVTDALRALTVVERYVDGEWVGLHYRKAS